MLGFLNFIAVRVTGFLVIDDKVNIALVSKNMQTNGLNDEVAINLY
ncbi:hypothetical protein JCM19240_4862 [Vibrio maritimus]|uniref:Uncharacterized protein n=1 Tax=Vibrio maritimus TaxID=990268 RepID=A0A090TYI8_9VIBR|nr:hypothetical protein JCM19240_4862 [Vibrio maritimus]